MKIFFKEKKSFIDLLIALLVFASLIWGPNSINSKFIILFSMYGIVSFLFLDRNMSKFKKVFRFYMPMVLLFLVYLLSLLYSDDLRMGSIKIQRLTSLIIFATVFSCTKFEKRTLRRIFNYYPFVVLVACLYSHSVVVKKFIVNKEDSLRKLFNLDYSYKVLGDTIDLHTTYYSLYILIAIVIVLENFKRFLNLYEKFLYLLLIGYFSFFVLHLSSRMCIILLYIVILFNIIRFFSAKRQFFKGIAVTIIFHMALFMMASGISATKYRFQHILGFTYYTGYMVNDGEHKLNLWKAALDANKNFLIGNGVGDIQNSLNRAYAKNNLQKPLKENYNSHNQYIEVYVGMGITGLIVFLYLLGYYLFFFIKHKNSIGIQFMIIISLISLTECIWNRHNGLVFICFMLGLLLQLSLTEHERLRKDFKKIAVSKIQ